MKVKDIAAGSTPAYPNRLTRAGERLFFVANDGSSGEELWTSDGTEAGTVQVADLTAGSGGSSFGDLGALGSTAFFALNQSGSGQELWSSDGTAGGTSMLADINPGTAGSQPREFTELEGVLYFAANGSTGAELWRTDGTGLGTYRLAGETATLGELVAGEGKVFFSTGVPSSPNDPGSVWQTDGTDGGTTRLSSGFVNVPRSLAYSDGQIFFNADDRQHGSEPWVTTFVPDAPVVTAPLAGQREVGTSISVAGTGQPGATVTASIGALEVGSFPVDSSGAWSGSVLPGYGGHALVFTQTRYDATSEPTPEVGVALRPAPPTFTSPSGGSVHSAAVAIRDRGRRRERGDPQWHDGGRHRHGG